jgi:hypothetical protein
MTRFPIWLIAASISLGCAHKSQMAQAPVSVIDSLLPPTILNPVIAYYATEAKSIILDDHTSSCMDLSLPQFRGRLTDTLSIQARQAAADCHRRSETQRPVPVSTLRISVPITPQSARRGYASLKTPLVFLSQVGFSDDGTVALIDGSMYCGGGLCASNDVFWFRRSGNGWELYTTWNLSVS